MPTREFHCDACEHHFEDFFFSIKDDNPSQCPLCEEPYGESFCQIYHGGIGIVKGEPTTIGQQAELNARRMGKEQMQMMREQERDKSISARAGFTGQMPKGAKQMERPTENPWFRSGDVPGLPRMDKPLNLKKVKNKEKYIRTGKAD